MIGLGAIDPFLLQVVPVDKPTPRRLAIAKANRLCNAITSYRPIARLPKGMIFTFVDLGPRVITVTHHNTVTGPHPRNGEQIADIMTAFRGSEAEARALIAK
jgi:hypothetical protein